MTIKHNFFKARQWRALGGNLPKLGSHLYPLQYVLPQRCPAAGPQHSQSRLWHVFKSINNTLSLLPGWTGQFWCIHRACKWKSSRRNYDPLGFLRFLWKSLPFRLKLKIVFLSLICFTKMCIFSIIINLQSNSVKTNSRGPAESVCCNRDSLYPWRKTTTKFNRYSH